MSQLSRDLKKSRKAAYAAGTSRNHRTQWRTYLYFTIHFKLVFLPASVQTICLFCQFLSRSLTPPSIRNYLSGVMLFHLMLGFSFPDLSAYELHVTRQGIERLAQHISPSAYLPPLPLPLNSCKLLCLAGLIFTPPDVTFSCAFLFAFFLFARISNLFPDSLGASGVQDYKRIDRGDVVPTHYGLCVQFTWSKT